MTTTVAITDSLGTEIRIGDTVVINAWGAPVRLTDTGKRAVVLGFSRTGNLILDDLGHPEGIANGRSVRPGYVGVAHRGGGSGFEGNRARCSTCGDPLDAPTGAGPRAACANTHGGDR